MRCSLYDGTDKLAKESGVSFLHTFATPRDGEATQDADELCGLVFAAVDESLGRISERVVKIAGVALSTFWHSILGVARRGRPTSPVFTWADRRAVDAAGELRERLDEAAVHRRTWCVLHSGYLPAKLLWLSRSCTEAFENTERWISPGEYLHLGLFREAGASTSMASGTGLFDQNREVWHGECCAPCRSKRSSSPTSRTSPRWGCWEIEHGVGRRSPRYRGSRRSGTASASTSAAAARGGRGLLLRSGRAGR
jgi:gluconokinase